MSTSAYLATGGVMGVLLVATVLALARGRSGQRYTPEREGRSGLLSWLVHDMTAWLLAFVLLCVAAIGGTVAAIGGGSATTMLVGIGLAVAGFVALAIYGVAKSRGHPHSHAVGEAVVALGALALLAVVGQLLTSFGA